MICFFILITSTGVMVFVMSLDLAFVLDLVKKGGMTIWRNAANQNCKNWLQKGKCSQVRVVHMSLCLYIANSRVTRCTEGFVMQCTCRQHILT